MQCAKKPHHIVAQLQRRELSGATLSVILPAKNLTSCVRARETHHGYVRQFQSQVKMLIGAAPPKDY